MAQRTVDGNHTTSARGRGAVSNPDGRFESTSRTVDAEALQALADAGELPEQPTLPTEVTAETARSVIARNDSPDLAHNQSINPYRGCEHGCIYCYARPSHAYLGLSPGLDFETRLRAKTNAAERLRAELAAPGYRPDPVMIGANTDAWQPAERQWRITREVLEVLSECNHPAVVVTKSALVERDIDLLADMAKRNLALVFLSITTLDATLARRMEPRAAAPARRLEAVRALSAAGVPCGVMVAPVIPALTDRETEDILAAGSRAGARHAGYVLLRLPHEVAPLFREWLQQWYPLKAAHVMSILQQMRGGQDYDATFGTRMRGTGPFAELLAQRFERACVRLGLDRGRIALDCSRFRPPSRNGQLSLF